MSAFLENKKDQIIKAESLWLEAHLNLNVTQLNALMHADYQIVRSNGDIWNKGVALASYRKDSRVWESAHFANLDIRIYSCTALVTGLWTAKGKNSDAVFDYQTRYLSVWLEESPGDWKIVHDQSVLNPI
jgi:ketosteroid isomerase-like protein